MATYRGSATPSAGTLTRAQANEIAITDADNYFAGTEVESALAELAVSVGEPASLDSKYIQVSQSVYTVVAADLIDGHNIFGINYAGAVTVIIPDVVEETNIIIIKDESGQAGTNNITIVTGE